MPCKYGFPAESMSDVVKEILTSRLNYGTGEIEHTQPIKKDNVASFLKDFLENSYEKDLGYGDIIILTSCEIRERAEKLLGKLENNECQMKP